MISRQRWIVSTRFLMKPKEPIVTEIINRNPAITVAIYGNVSEKLLHETAEKIRDDLIDTGPISLAELIGTRAYEISVEVSEENLRRYGISFDHVVKALKTGSVDLPAVPLKHLGAKFLFDQKASFTRAVNSRSFR